VSASVGFYFDYASPFAYLASTQLASITERTGATFELRPVLLGAIFKAIGTPMVPLFAMPQAKQRMMPYELARWSDHFGVRFRFASRFPQNSVKALRMTIAAPDDKRLALMHALFRTIWADDGDLSSDDDLRAAATSVGLDADEAIGSTSRDDMKAALRDATDGAVKRGVFGVPTFDVGGELYWGQDRIELVEIALGVEHRAL
jgi:2-hydroxychromene-2-carboxylate isomerase